MDYLWTQHSLYKMKQYGLSEQRVRRVIRAPFRVEEGIVKDTIAVMQPAGNYKTPKAGQKPDWKQEIWVMYKVPSFRPKTKSNKKLSPVDQSHKVEPKKLKIISAWKYPGVSPKNNPIPAEILREISRLS